jgi:hypothetical protein
MRAGSDPPASRAQRRRRQDVGGARLGHGESEAPGAGGRERLSTIPFDGTVKHAVDGGRTWTDVVTPS